MPVQATTTLPDTQDLTLDNSVEDEVTASTTDVSNYGSYRWEIRESDENQSWGAVATATTDESDPDTVFTGLEDGEKYDVRVRTQTEHATGAWYSAEVVTLLPPPTNLGLTAAETSVDASWTDQSDNEDGFRIYREEYYDGTYLAAEQVGSVGANTTSVTDDTVDPLTKYRYHVQVYTEHVVADSATATTTTGGDAVPVDKQVPASDVYVEIDHPDGSTIRPTVVADPSYNPQLNDLPRIELPLKASPRWEEDTYVEQPIRVWKDGDRLPIDTIVEVSISESRATVRARGGSELLTDVNVEVDSKPAHTTAKDQVESETPYTPNVDAPDPDPITNQTIASGDTTSELDSQASTPDPIDVVDGRIQLKDTAVVKEGENPNEAVLTESDGAFSSGEAVEHNTTNDSYTWGIQFDYDVPADRVGIAIRDEMGGSDGTQTDGLYWEFAGDQLGEVSADGQSKSLGWVHLQTDGWLGIGSGYDGGDLQAGQTYTLELKADGASNPAQYHADVVVVYDTKYSYVFDNDNGGSGGYLDGPQTKPDAVDVLFDTVPVAYSVGGERVELTIDDTSNKQQIALSNDGGASFPQTQANTDTFEADFAELGATPRFRVTLSRYGSRSDQTPTTGFKSQSIDGFQFKADLEDTPVLVNERYTGTLLEVLQSIANYGRFLFEVQYDDDGFTVEWMRPGLRTATESGAIDSFSKSVDASSIRRKVEVRGAALTTRNESVTANHGTAVDLQHSDVVTGSEVVYDPTDGREFERGVDYTMDYTAGEITTTADGDMTDGATYEIDYRWKVTGMFEADDYSGNAIYKQTVTIPDLTTAIACRQTALQVVKKVDAPVVSVDITLSPTDAQFQLVDSISFADLPVDQPLAVHDVQNTPSEVVLRLGSREATGEVISRIKARVAATEERV